MPPHLSGDSTLTPKGGNQQPPKLIKVLNATSNSIHPYFDRKSEPKSFDSNMLPQHNRLHSAGPSNNNNATQNLNIHRHSGSINEVIGGHTSNSQAVIMMPQAAPAPFGNSTISSTGAQHLQTHPNGLVSTVSEPNHQTMNHQRYPDHFNADYGYQP